MNFWENKTLAELDSSEWESLCDGCARCCLHKLEDEDTGEVHYTSIVCQYLDHATCKCKDYVNRNVNVPNCVHLTLDNIEEFHWLPNTCAYRLMSEGKPLPTWHPLITGRRDSVREANIVITDKVIDERNVPEDAHEEYIIRWVEQ